VTDKHIAVIGQGAKAFQEAVFLRSYTRHITLLCPKTPDLEPGHRARLAELGIPIGGEPLEFEVEQKAIAVRTMTATYRFNSIYPALGSKVQVRTGFICWSGVVG